jgi:DNA-binding transcriptional ArsR family regulator
MKVDVPRKINSPGKLGLRGTIDLPRMTAASAEASELLKSLANRHRLLILCQLVDGERCVGSLAESLLLRDSTVSQHLALLRKDGIVAARRDGQAIYYRIGSQAARQLLQTLYTIYCAPGAKCAPPAKSARGGARSSPARRQA